MAKKRNRRDDQDARARQGAASRAAGLEFKYNTGFGTIRDERTMYFGPAAQGPLDNPNYVAVTRPNSWTVQDVLGEMYRNVEANVPKSKQAQTRFLASEKKKSGRNTAKNVKRRER